MQTIPSLDFGQAIKLCFQNYAKCSGRSRRSEYWYFHLFGLILYFILSAVLGSISTSMVEQTYYNGHYVYTLSDSFYFFILVLVVASIAMAIPSISVTVRRLHDTGRPGIYYFVIFIPFAGPFILLYFCSIDSEERVNEYGPSPKYILPLNQPINPAPVTVVPVPVPVPVHAPVSPYPQPAMAQGVPTYSQPPMAQPVPTYNQPPVAQPVPYAQPGPSQPYMPPPQPVTYPGQQIPPPYPQ